MGQASVKHAYFFKKKKSVCTVYDILHARSANYITTINLALF